jgi:hypothetical protein
VRVLSFSPGESGQGWIEYILIIALLVIIGFILYRLFAPAADLYLKQILSQIMGK